MRISAPPQARSEFEVDACAVLCTRGNNADSAKFIDWGDESAGPFMDTVSIRVQGQRSWLNVHLKTR